MCYVWIAVAPQPLSTPLAFVVPLLMRRIVDDAIGQEGTGAANLVPSPASLVGSALRADA